MSKSLNEEQLEQLEGKSGASSVVAARSWISGGGLLVHRKVSTGQLSKALYCSGRVTFTLKCSRQAIA